MEGQGKGTVCVTGGTGYLASWLIMKLLQAGYSVHTTVRSQHGSMRDVSYLTSLPGALTRLKIFNSDLDKPESFEAPINGCIGVFHVAHPMDFQDKEPEQVITQRAIDGTLGILRASLKSKTVKRVVYTSTVDAITFNGQDSDVWDEESWSDVDFIRAHFMKSGGSYYISKTLTERAALAFGEKHGLDVVTIAPSFIHGPFINPDCPASVHLTMSIIFGEETTFPYFPLVHIDDVVGAEIFLLDYPNAKGRYICSALQITTDKLSEFTLRYPELQILKTDFSKQMGEFLFPCLSSKKISSKKLLDTGFKYQYGLEEMYDGAIRCCKEKSIL